MNIYLIGMAIIGCAVNVYLTTFLSKCLCWVLGVPYSDKKEREGDMVLLSALEKGHGIFIVTLVNFSFRASMILIILMLFFSSTVLPASYYLLLFPALNLVLFFTVLVLSAVNRKIHARFARDVLG